MFKHTTKSFMKELKGERSGNIEIFGEGIPRLGIQTAKGTTLGLVKSGTDKDEN